MMPTDFDMERARNRTTHSIKRSGFFLTCLILLGMLFSLYPVGGKTIAQAQGAFTFAAEADARVLASDPAANFGTLPELRVENPGQASYIRFVVTGVTGTVQSATLRLFVTEGSPAGTSLYSTDARWTETGLTWKNRPAPISGPIPNTGVITANTWTEYNVTAYVTGNGAYSFALLADGADGASFYSREGSSPPELVITFISEPTPTPTSTPLGLNVLNLSGTTNENYGFTVPDNVLFDATNWTSIAIGPSPEGTTTKAVEIHGTDTSTGGGANITWRGGLIVGLIPRAWTWREAHDFGGAGVFIYNDGAVEGQYIRIHNVEDGIKFREAPEYSNTGSWVLRDCYFTAIRDDAIDNDRFEPGTVQDCLFDGVYVFLSEQNENVGTNIPIGPNEDNAIYVNRVYARLYGTNAAEGPGKWFKLLGNVPHHRVVVSDSVFAIGSAPRLGWLDGKIPPEVSWIGDNNFILWLGAPGTYGGPKPPGVTFLEGAAAQDKWISVRNQWLTDHGLPPQDLPADYNPHDAPVMQIPAGF
jgi:hypothetical protein